MPILSSFDTLFFARVLISLRQHTKYASFKLGMQYPFNILQIPGLNSKFSDFFLSPTVKVVPYLCQKLISYISICDRPLQMVKSASISYLSETKEIKMFYILIGGQKLKYYNLLPNVLLLFCFW